MNLGMVMIDALSLRVLFPAFGIGMALVAREKGWGILPAMHLSNAFSIVIGVLMLDGVIYFQHLIFYAVPLFWRLHMVHHTDLDLDVTTALRFHPLEILLSMGIKVAAIAVIGPPVVAVLIFEIILNATAMFNHGNVCMPRSVDRILRLFVVTPDMAQGSPLRGDSGNQQQFWF